MLMILKEDNICLQDQWIDYQKQIQILSIIVVSNIQEVDLWNSQYWRGCPRGVMVKAMDCEIVIREFVLQSRYYVHFRANTLGKGMNRYPMG